MRRLKPLLVSAAVTGALVGGGAAVANAATSTTSTSAAPATGTTGTTGPTGSSHPAPTPGARGTHHCPGM